jgi:Transposase IS116/IS110/IS902 family
VQSSAWEPRGGVRHPSAGKAPREVSQRKTLDHRRPQGQKPPPVQLSVLGPSGGDDAGSGITADSHHGARVISLEQAPDDGPHVMVRLLARVIGVGVETADMLVQEVLSRNLRDRRAVARYGGLTGSPDESGKKRREKGLARSGNAMHNAVTQLPRTAGEHRFSGLCANLKGKPNGAATQGSKLPRRCTIPNPGGRPSCGSVRIICRTAVYGAAPADREA